nr:VanZ family protein [Limisphaera ngatamarikiensis]
MRGWLWYWVPVGLWMALIFTASADSASAPRTSRIIGPLVRWLFPDWPEAWVEVAVLVVRKLAHVVEYAVLAFLVWRALWRPRRPELRFWEWRPAVWSLVVVFLYAVTDEYHQTFVPDRQGSLRDVLLDTAGGILGLAFAWGLTRWWYRSPARKERTAGAAASLGAGGS